MLVILAQKINKSTNSSSTVFLNSFYQYVAYTLFMKCMLINLLNKISSYD